MKLDEAFWEEEEKVSASENESLEAPFTEEEIRIAVFDSYAKGASGPDGFSFPFYIFIRDIINMDLMNLVRSCEAGNLNLSILNYAMITLIQKRDRGQNS